MDVVTLDFETYYEKGKSAYSLRNMTTHEYVLDDRFETICVAVAYNDDAPVVLTHDNFARFASRIDWSQVALVGHNLYFDGYILAMRYNVTPGLYIDTLGMARAVIGGRLERHGLDKVAQYLGVGGKLDAGKALMDVAGKRFSDLSGDELTALAQYAKQDVEITRKIFQAMWPRFPKAELRMLDWTIRAACHPRIVLDPTPLREELKQEKHLRAYMVAKSGVERSVLMSNQKFAEALQALGVEPPTKTSPTTGRKTWAFDKKSEEFIALQDHPDERVRNLVEARLAVKTTIKETRAAKLLRMAEMGRPVPMPLQFSGAMQTHRFSGGDGMNPQNFPKKSRQIEDDKIVSVPSRIRAAMTGGPGRKVVVVDSSNIELRVCHWLAGNETLLDVVRNGGDPYCHFASKVYGVEVNPKVYPEGSHERDEHARMRTIGKIALLGLQYGMGATKYADTVRDWTGIVIEPDEAERIVQTYRAENIRIKNLWRVCGQAAENVARGMQPYHPASLGYPQMAAFVMEYDMNEKTLEFVMPRGLRISYPKLRVDDDEGLQFYCPRKAGKNKYTRLYGGVMVENATQALASEIIRTQKEQIMRRFRDELGLPVEAVTLQVHDEVVAIVEEDRAEAALNIMIEEMSRAPDWANGLPLDAEGSIADNYGEAK